MTEHGSGFALVLALPPSLQEPLRAWTERTPGATWDSAGAHVTVARLTGKAPAAEVVRVARRICAATDPFEVALRRPLVSPYWGREELNIVLLTGGEAADIRGVLLLRERLVAALTKLGVSLAEGGTYVPHLTLTTGLPSTEAAALAKAARSLDVRFRAEQVSLWTGAEGDAAAPDQAWHLVETLRLGRAATAESSGSARE